MSKQKSQKFKKSQKIPAITEKTLISALIDEHPEVAEILMSYGLHCVGCHFSEFDTLEDGAMMHGLSDEDVEMMVRDINEAVNEKVNAVASEAVNKKIKSKPLNNSRKF